MSNTKKVKTGVLQCIMNCATDEYETQCLDCPYYSEEITLAECRKELREDFLTMLKEQEQKTGHWVYLQYCANEGVYCSECHIKMFDRYPMKKKLSQFCGHCGAKMDEQVVIHDD